MKDSERIDKLEAKVLELTEALETLAHIQKTHDKQLQRHIVELTDHFAANLHPKVKSIVYRYIDVIREDGKERERQ